MARMSREFQLVLLGAGLLTAGSFLWPDNDPALSGDDQASGGGGGSSSSRRARTGGVFIFTSYTRTTTTTAASATSRGGFGRSGVSISGG